MSWSLEIEWSDHAPKYLQLANALENWIIHEQLQPGTRLPSSRQIARKWKLTLETVNRGLRELQNHGIISRRVGSGTYVEGWRRSLRIGLVCHTLFVPDSCYVSPFLLTMDRFWRQQGYDVLTLVRTPEQYEDAFIEFNLSGLLAFGPDDTGIAMLESLREKNLPVIGFGVPDPGANPALFGLVSRGTATIQVQYLLRLGHRRIAMVGSVINYNDRIREKELIRCLWEAELPFNPDWLVNPEPGQMIYENESFLQLMRSPERPTALLLVNGNDVLPLYEALSRLKLRIPEDVSVLGMDDPAFAGSLTPPLTVFRQPVSQMTEQACEQLLRMINREPLQAKTIFRAELVNRSSCCAPAESTDIGFSGKVIDAENAEYETVS